MEQLTAETRNFETAMYSAADAVVPVFLERVDSDKIEHIGSAVLLQLRKKLFILTAAHVADYHVDGTLCIPINGEFHAIQGGLASLGKPDRRFFRKDDPLDVAYILATENFRANILKFYKPIAENECWFHDNTLPQDIYSISGFPLTKTKERGGLFTGESFNYTGEAAVERKYQALNFDPKNNIIINFRVKKSADMYTNVKGVAPHPKGASGGAILRWPKSEKGVLDGIERGSMRQLCGIIHTYKKTQNCMVGTKLGVYIDWIRHNNPELAPNVEQYVKTEDSIPMYQGFVMYQEDDWEGMKAHAHDSSTMCDTWAEWRDGIERGYEQMHRGGVPMIPMIVTSGEMKVYCDKNSVVNNSSSRIMVCNRKMYEALREIELEDKAQVNTLHS